MGKRTIVLDYECYLTIKKAAEVLGVSKETLRRWDKMGKLKAYRHHISNYILYKMSDLNKVFEDIKKG